MMAGLEGDEDPPSIERHIHYNKRGELRMVGEKSLFDLDEPIWHADEKSRICDRCSAEFTFTHRRHHCRRCGEVVCGNCVEKAPLARMGFVDPVVVCKTCIPICKAEEDFFKNHLKTLTAGAYFHLSDSPHAAIEYFCKLSTDSRQIIISEGHLPISMKQILEVKTLTGEEAKAVVLDEEVKKKHGSKQISLELVFKSGGLEQKIVLCPAKTHSRKQSSDWLRALKKALIMLNSTK